MVMSSMVLMPPSTQLEMGQDTNLSLGSISVTSTFSPHMRMYLAQVAPP